MRHITVVGGGQAGLLLAIGLRQGGYQVRLVQNRSADELRTGKVLSSQCVFAAARAEERALGARLWANSAPSITGMRVQVAAPDGSGAKAIGFEGLLTGPGAVSRPAVKFSEFLQVFAPRAAAWNVRCRRLRARTLRRRKRSCRGGGRQSRVARLFARDASRSPFDQPMRALALVNVHGMPPHEGPRCVTATLIPGVGELFMIPALTHSGPCDILFFEANSGWPA